jgi:perosamine synthetase
LYGIDLAPTPCEPAAPLPEGTIPLCEPDLRGNEWAYIKECLDTNWVSSVGPFVDRFERSVATYVGAQYGVATVTGTAALHIALLVVGVQPDDEVLVSTLTFIAPANAIRYCGAWPVFIDAEPHHWQMDPEQVADFLGRECCWVNGALHNKTTRRRVRAILPVHILGHPVDMDPILHLARTYNLTVIEDATESLGAQYKGGMVGHLSDIGCFSFNGNKTITTGSGGMLVTDNADWACKAKYLTTQAKDNAVEYIHYEVGYNYRLTNLQAAMGCAQMERLEAHIAAKRCIATTYTAALRQVPGLTPLPEAPWAFSTFWLYTVLVDQERYGLDRQSLMRHLAEDGMQTRPLWQPLHRSPAHHSNVPRLCPIAERLQRTALSLPCSVHLASDQYRIITAILSATADRQHHTRREEALLFHL